MNKNILMTAIVPHPPIIVPEVGQGEEKKAQVTLDGIQKLSEQVLELNPETIVIVTPHSEFNPYFFSVYSAPVLRGNFANFRAPEVNLQFENDTEFIEELESRLKDDFIRFNRIAEKAPLDHGSMVPLYYLAKAGYKGKILVINYTVLDKEKHKLFGKFIAETADKLSRKSVFIASGDLSHKLIQGAPAGYSPEARNFDELIVNSIQNGDFQSITDISYELREIAGECGYNSIMVALGVVSDKPEQNKVISYEGPFGVGYIVAKL